MAAELKAQSQKTREAEADLAKLNADLKWELAQAAVDMAGIVDPTPISDVVGAGMSLARGDWIGAGLSLISVIPYAGDAIGKTAKGARALKRMNDLRKRIDAAIGLVQRLKSKAGKRAAEAIKAKRKAEAAKRAERARVIQDCDPPANPWGTNLPKEGKWKGDKGDSEWTAPDGQKVKYKEGYPDFSNHAKHSVEIDVKGNHSTDFTGADEAVRKKLGDPNWERPDTHTWHHKEDGVTMELVPKEIHNAAKHKGGVSTVNDKDF